MQQTTVYLQTPANGEDLPSVEETVIIKTSKDNLEKGYCYKNPTTWYIESSSADFVEKPSHWLKPTTGYFFTPEEFREVLIKAQESACKQLLSDMAKGFLENKDKVEIFSDKAVFQAIGETIQKFPLPDFQTFYNQLTESK